MCVEHAAVKSEVSFKFIAGSQGLHGNAASLLGDLGKLIPRDFSVGEGSMLLPSSELPSPSAFK